MNRLISSLLLLCCLNGLAAEPAAPRKGKAAADVPPRIEGSREAAYKQAGEHAMKLWILGAGGPPAPAKPAIVFFFGGGWTSGTPTQFERQARHFVDRGLVAVLVDYRVKSRHGVKAVDDEILTLLDRAAVTFQVVMTKADKVNRATREANIAQTMAALQKHPAAYPEIVVTSSEKGEGVVTLRAIIATLE